MAKNRAFETRRNKTYTKVANVGWVQDDGTQKRDYDEYCNDSWAFLISFFLWYPDALLDVMRDDGANYKNEELIQRVMVRAFARYQYVDITGCRSLTKTNTIFKYKLTNGILWPGTKTSYYGPSLRQQAKLAKSAYKEMQDAYPALTKHYNVDSMAKEDFGISTPYRSMLTVNGTRGDNIHSVIAEEYAQEEAPAFDFEEYSTVILFAVRMVHMVQGERDRTYIPYQQHSITSAGRKQNHSYETRCAHLRAMQRGQSAFVMDVPWQVVVLSQMRPLEWVEQRKQESTPDKWMREMESRYTGTDQNPIVRDEVLTESRKLMLMEEHHCCKDRDNKLAAQDVIYIVGYDVSYEDDKKNAKCACVVVKCTKQKEWLKRDKYLKEVVWVDDWPPNGGFMEQAKRLKRVWYRFCCEGSQTYIAIDSWQYGKGVLQALMMDLGDGLAPLCIYNHASDTEYELENALPVIYPIKAGGPGVTDPDSEIIRNAEIQFENRNVVLLTSNGNAGVEAYKKYHRIKDDNLDYQIYAPYRKTRELVGQIQNLKKVLSGATVSERRISKSIQRDSWSALKYALRFAQHLERQNLQKAERKSDWWEVLEKYKGQPLIRDSEMPSNTRLPMGRRGGRII